MLGKMEDHSADKYIHLENELNKILFRGVPIGGLFANEFFIRFSNTQSETNWRQFFSVFKLFFKTWKNGLLLNKIQNKNVSIIITKVGNNKHLNKLIDPIAKQYTRDAILVNSEIGNQNNHISFQSIPALGFYKLIYVFWFCIRFFSTIHSKFLKDNVSIERLTLFLILFLQTLKLQTWLILFDKVKPKLALFDLDRYINTSPIVLAANNKGIKSITLVHGVISSPYGYNPVLANEIWCWGEVQKKLLQKMGVEESRIRITGNPIAKREILISSQVIDLKEAYSISKNQQVIGVAINPIENSKKYNSLIIQLVIDAIQEFNNDSYVVLIKFHPSQKISDIDERILNNPTIRVFNNSKNSNMEFFSLCNILLTHNSGIGYEAIVNDLLVGIINNIPIDQGNGKEMVELGNCPEFKNSKDLYHFLKDFENIKVVLLNNQKRFVLNEYYHKIDEEATNEILKNIHLKLRESDNSLIKN